MEDEDHHTLHAAIRLAPKSSETGCLDAQPHENDDRKRLIIPPPLTRVRVVRIPTMARPRKAPPQTGHQLQSPKLAVIGEARGTKIDGVV